MSLRFRLNLLISTLFLLILLAAAALVIRNARDSVARELESSAHLALELLEVALVGSHSSEYPDGKLNLLERIIRLEKFRHLRLRVVTGDPASLLPIEDQRAMPLAPAWFVWLVRPVIAPWRQTLTLPAGQAHEVMVVADPADEISEAWKEAYSLLVLAAVLFVLANAMVFVAIGYWLRPVATILDGLDSIEQGHYHRRLVLPKLPELAAIACKFNLMAEVLERTHEENCTLAQRSLTIQEAERRYLARELHDEFGQSLSAIKAVAVSIIQRTDDGQIRAGLQTICTVAGHVYDGARQLMRRLRPAILDELGLVTALQELIDDWNSRHEESFCRFFASESLGNLPEAVTITCYRIAQEALTNVSKHAMAREVEISLRRQAGVHGEEAIKLTIRDDGIGMCERATPKGLGLLGIRERVAALHGILRIISSQGSGTLLDIYLPLGA